MSRRRWKNPIASVMTASTGNKELKSEGERDETKGKIKECVRALEREGRRGAEARRPRPGSCYGFKSCLPDSRAAIGHTAETYTAVAYP